MTDRYAKVREMENKLRTMQQLNHEENKAAAVAHWQVKAEDKMRQQTVQRRFDALKARREQDLNLRRQKLAEKLVAEDMALRKELIDGKETPEQRRAKLAERARALASKREQERQALAAKLYEQAFAESCDVLRGANSKRVLYRTVDERQAQIEHKMAAKILEEEEARMFAEMNETERLKMEQRHIDDKRKAQERRDATIVVLDAQMRAVELRKQEEADAKRQEVAELQALWRRLAEEQEQVEQADKEKMRKLAADLKAFNALKQTEMSERDRRERELDLRILQEALTKEAQDEAREAAAREKRRQDVRRYREQLAHMVDQDALDEADRDAMIEAMAASQRAKEDAERAAREDARARLMAEVDAIRQQQIADRQAGRHQALMDEAYERARIEADVEAMKGEKERARMEQQRRALEQRLQIQTQMVAKAHIRAAVEDEKLSALEEAEAAEKAYLSKVKDTLENTDAQRWFGRKKFQWYT